MREKYGVADMWVRFLNGTDNQTGILAGAKCTGLGRGGIFPGGCLRGNWLGAERVSHPHFLPRLHRRQDHCSRFSYYLNECGVRKEPTHKLETRKVFDGDLSSNPLPLAL